MSTCFSLLFVTMHLNWIFENLCYCFSPTSMVVTIATLFVAVVYYSLKTSGLPPGPTGVPILGYWPFIDHKETHLQFDALKKKHGDVFSLNVTGTLYINLGTFKAAREAHIAKSDCFSKRTESFSLVTELFAGGLLAQNSEEWKVSRKFFLQVLKERVSLSVKDALSGSLYDSVNSTVDELREKKGETVNIVEFLIEKCNANLRLTLFGENEVSAERVREINECYAVMMAIFTAPNLLVAGNIGRYLIFPFTPGYKDCIVNLRKVEKIIYKIIDEHKSTYDEEHIRDIIDDYIKERIVRRRNGDSTAHFFTDKALMSTLLQIVGDGVYTVAAFIALFVKALLDHPEEQEKIYREMVEVVGVDRQPTIEDKSRLSYTNAFIQEALRTSDVLPFFPSLECTRETTLGGYRIPKRAIVILNMYSIHNDQESHDEPQKFDPTRYILTEGKSKPEPLVTFGIGKRACIGESFTMLQIFLFVTTLIKNFHIFPPEGVNRSSLELFHEGRLRILLKPRN